MKVLAAIPCFNEELTIGSVVLKARQHVDEVLVVDDGSADGTAAVAKAAGAQVITHDKNKGKGAVKH
jgi:glycosyltransferase involved in cell wall biosynthesis